MKKLIDIPEELVEPLKIMAVKEKKSFHAIIIDTLAKAVEANKAKSFLQ